MHISYQWLQDFVELPFEASETAEILTDLGLEVEGIKEFSPVKGGLNGVVVGEVKECIPHPNADKLKLTKVNIGTDAELPIVCGAPNVAAGQKVLVATVGTTLFTEEGEFKIKKAKIRGEVSEGMICSEKELGLGDDSDGIMVLDAKAEPGVAASVLFNLETDRVFEIGLTPNRSDAMSHWGVARDLKAGLQQRGKSIKLVTPSTSNFRVDNRTLKIKVQVDDKNRAPRYCGITLNDLKVGSSPGWLQNRLKAIGLSPINNVVDATNYVLHELGQPLHAFDADKIAGNSIIVKTVDSGTKFTTLDGVERTLDKEDLMICDAEKPLCIAGVFGGIESGVTEETTSIFLESAFFDPVSIRKTAKRHGLTTDASFRFERGIDPNITDYALRRAAVLIKQLAGGSITSDLVDLYPKKIEGNRVLLQFEKVNQIIGQEIPIDTIKNILTSLDMKITNMTEIGVGITIPPYRNDVTREIDVIEEILRIYGYNNISFDTKLNASIAGTQPIEDYQVRNKVASLLTARGFNEILNNSLSSPKYRELSRFPEDKEVPILNPLSAELSVMRSNMVFSGLETIAFNLNRKNNNLHLFEFGKTYWKTGSDYHEKTHLTLFLNGNRNEESWNVPNSPTDFFYGRGIVEGILERLGIADYTESSSDTAIFSEAVGFRKKKKTLVEFGILNKNITKNLDVNQEVFYADFDWEVILNQIPKENFNVRAIPRFPGSERDFALLIDSDVKFIDLKTAAEQVEKKLLKNVSLFDVYTGKNLPEGKKSYALKFIFQDENKTLTDAQIDNVMNRLREKFETEFGASLR